MGNGQHSTVNSTYEHANSTNASKCSAFLLIHREYCEFQDSQNRYCY